VKKVVMKMEGFADGRRSPVDGMYLKYFDHEAHGGTGAGEFTVNKVEAMVFKDHGTAFEFWTKVPKCKPLRADGKPNKPLTASTVSFLPWEDA